MGTKENLMLEVIYHENELRKMNWFHRRLGYCIRCNTIKKRIKVLRDYIERNYLMEGADGE